MNINFYRLNKTKNILCAFLNKDITDENIFLDTLASKISTDIDILHLENTDMSTDKFVQLAEKIKILCAEYSTLFIIVERCDIATLINSDGMYIPANGLKYDFCRHMLGKEKIIGTYILNIDELNDKKSSIDYVITADLQAAELAKKESIPCFLDTKHAQENNLVCLNRVNQ